ncbi:hypothetical protein ACIPSE_01205 [Streptomyces sp. NPDC090106]|uniref:hypothetical protein n=1 Tax=Streptomyces sp. NPDC090106 TaxID=3365946 RepID=UPI00382368F2
MTEKIPDPPNYSSGPTWTEPEIHVHFTPENEPVSRWDFTWLQIGQNTKAIAVSIVVAPWWAAALRSVHDEQGLAGAWFMAFAGIGVMIFFDHARQRFMTRALAWVAVLGAVEALPVFSTIVHLLTGSAS